MEKPLRGWLNLEASTGVTVMRLYLLDFLDCACFMSKRRLCAESHELCINGCMLIAPSGNQTLAEKNFWGVTSTLRFPQAHETLETNSSLNFLLV